MRILFVGNTNNEPFRLAAEMVAQGATATVVLAARGSLHDPSELLMFPYYGMEPIKVVRKLRWMPQYSWMQPRRLIVREISRLAKQHDFAVLNGVAHALGPLLGIPWASMITGSDATSYASSSFHLTHNSKWAKLEARFGDSGIRDVLVRFSERQRAGIRESAFIVGAPRGQSADLDRILEEAGSGGQVRLPFIAGPSLPQLEGLDSPNLGASSRWGDQAPVVLAARLSSASLEPSLADFDDKGSQIALQGWLLAEQAGFSRPLVLFRKGKHARELEEAIRTDYSLSNLVWKSPVTYGEYVRLIGSAHAVIDSLGKSPVGRGAIEAIANHIPLISSSDDEKLGTRLGVQGLHGVRCQTPEDLASALLSDDLACANNRSLDLGWGKPNRHAETILSLAMRT